MKKEHTSTKQTASHPDSEARFRNIVENLNDVIYILNERAEITYITPNIESTSGYSVSDVTGKRFTDFVHPDDLPERMERFENAFSGTSEATEYRLVNKFGDVVWVRNSARPVIQDGTVVGVQGVLTDITERKEYEERLQQQFSYSEALNRILDIIISQDISDESLNDIIGIMGKTLQLDRALIYQIRLEEQLAVGLCEWLNPDCPEAKPTMGIYPLQAFGQWSAHMLETKRYLESHHDDIHPKLSESGSSDMLHDQMHIKSLLWHPFAFSPDGCYVLAFDQIRYRRTWKKEELDFLKTVNRQVSLAMQKLAFLAEHEQAKEQMQESEKKFRGIFENAPLGIFHFDDAGIITECNDPFVRIIGSTREKLIGLDTTKLSDRKMVEALKRVLGGHAATYEGYYRSVTAEKETPVKVYFEPILSRMDLIQGGIGIVEDITEQKKAEDSIKRSLHEKNILLSEIHHRVKNNMAVISSMITLQTEFFNDQKSADEVLQVTQSRIKSMALVHELVYENNNFAEIHIGKLLQRLVDNLEEIYNPGDKEISVDVRTEDFMLNMNDSIPFSLLVNEVVTNAYKHAFQDRDSGKIEITLDRKNGLCHVSIADNGIGLSDTAHIENPQSLGYTIINGLVNQLNGALAFRTRGAGLCLELTFPLNETDHAKT